MKTLLAAGAIVVLLVGCAQAPTHTSAALPSLLNSETTVRPATQAPVPVSRGSLVPASQLNPPVYRSLFEDRRPARVGDTLMIVLNETTRASKLGGTQASRGSNNALNANTSLSTSSTGGSNSSRSRDNKLGLGVVMPQNVHNGSISSSMVADARIEYRGSGVTDEVQRPGWLTQLFMRYSPN